MRKAAAIFAAIFAFSAPSMAVAAQYKPFEVSGWIPYWRADLGIADTTLHLDTFTEINPFGYTVKQDGTLNDELTKNSQLWPVLYYFARQKNIRVIPTVMWSNGEAIHATLSNKASRTAHINEIVKMVNDNNFDGVDIDYEAKLAETKPYFSAFLKELYTAMGQKWVMCTIEARTPPEDRFRTPPPTLEYANDFVQINKYCDRVKFMTYDQGRIDFNLNDARPAPYVPVADVAWVEKAIRLAMKDISAKKIMIGVATYGYEHDMFPSTETLSGIGYSQLWSFNPGYATALATKFGLTPQRNTSGELYITFPAASSTEAVPLPNATRVLTWSDAEAIKQKLDLAKRLGVRGVSIFKIDGGEDAKMWDVLKAAK
jgi:spore germination protein YaaH